MAKSAEASLFKLMEQLVADRAVPGCALTLISDNVQHSFAFGYFSDNQSPKTTPNTVYDIASVSKLFTTALILRLHEAGEISVFDRCSNYLDNFRSSKISIIDLLTHRVDFNVELAAMRQSLPTGPELWKAIMKIQAPAEPTVDIHYANLPFIYLGDIVEEVTRASLWHAMNGLFEQLVLQQTYTGADIASQHIFTPPTEIVDGHIIQGVTHDETARLSKYGIAGNAGVFSTANDLAKFGQAWLKGQVVRYETLDQLVFRNYDTTNRNPQALGWWLRLPPNGEGIPTPDTYSHAGYTGPFLAIHPANQKACAFTCNRTYFGRDNRAHWQLWQPLIDWLRE